MYHKLFVSPMTGTALAVAFLAFAIGLVLLFTAAPLQGEATAIELTPESTAKHWAPTELPPEWRWSREPVDFEHMYRRLRDRPPVGSFDRVLDLAAQ